MRAPPPHPWKSRAVRRLRFNTKVTILTQQQQKVVQYLDEAHATELALARELQAQIAMTPKGRYRQGLEKHLRETRDHSRRIEERLGELGQDSPVPNPVRFGVGAVQAVAGQALALAKAPLNVIRGSGGEEKVLKNAKDACASEALETATYTSLAQLASAAGDKDTERLARSVLKDEQRMLDRLLKEIPRLTDAVARAEFDGEGSFEVTETGAADAVRKAGGTAERTARRGAAQAKRTGRRARKAPGVARAEGTVKGAVASESDLPIPNYDSLSANEVQGKLAVLSQVDLAKIDAYERKNQDRSTVTERIDSLRGDEPWAGYDELSVDEVLAALADGDQQRTKDVRAYERRHKARAGVLQAAESERSQPSTSRATAADQTPTPESAEGGKLDAQAEVEGGGPQRQTRGESAIAEWRGRGAVTSEGERIGLIDEIYADADTGKPEWLAVKTGMFGTKVSLIPIAEASESDGDVRVPYSTEQVKDAPTVEADTGLSQEEEAGLYRHYGLDYSEALSDSALPRGQANGHQGPDRDAVRGDTISLDSDDAMTRSEEELRLGKTSRERGRARLRKYVVTEQVQQTVPVQREGPRGARADQ
jgi:ferritin-like metal-binding protein YciE